MLENKVTSDEKLNLVLSEFLTETGRLLSFNNLSKKFSGKEIKNDAELSQIIDKLKKDNYLVDTNLMVEEVTEHTKSIDYTYILTFEGEMFIESGGYVAKKDKDIQERERISNIETQSQRTSKQMLNTTIILAVGTALLVIVDLLSHWSQIIKLFCNCW